MVISDSVKGNVKPVGNSQILLLGKDPIEFRGRSRSEERKSNNVSRKLKHGRKNVMLLGVKQKINQPVML